VQEPVEDRGRDPPPPKISQNAPVVDRVVSHLTSRSPTRGIPFLVSDLWFLASVPGAVPVTSRSSCPAGRGKCKEECDRREQACRSSGCFYFNSPHSRCIENTEDVRLWHEGGSGESRSLALTRVQCTRQGSVPHLEQRAATRRLAALRRGSGHVSEAGAVHLPTGHRRHERVQLIADCALG
jgi:hypothetical protein